MIAQIDRVAFNFLGIPIYWYALIIVSGIIIAMWLSSREAVRVGLKSEDITDFMLWGLPLSIIGARLYYILFDLPQYIADPIQIFNIRSGGLAIYGGLIAGAITLYFFTKYHFISMWTFLDIAAPSVILAQAIGRWGNFMNHEAYGPVTTRIFLENLHIPRFIIDNMYIEGFYRQPTFLYESVWSLIGFILLLFLRNKKHLLKKGEVLLVYVMWYSFGRFFIEGLRTDSLYFLGVIRISQLLSAFLFVGTIILFIWRRKKGNLPDYDRTFGKNQMII
ncbi:prolipoprotein diacylglyceryl transferase [Enterococcus hirae]|uniref:prolipoprotein diacylglyceryl transferase n=1 Tax=Enterococcus hirae TaxID=1354 RepID=UPI0010948C58|nr:prolipoprotein diacylglyceryl transferase [Enterococcus hirae]EMF0040190.1 prolipoprotein diacylglyceryl transferase [Enterococcus hirae]EMF0114629.1 prolipoprotein diacylglyceryl transferase [Enterococcus hirae]MBO1090587.1 prolipoprotein diacylglyceryl transferase [Enterococcus hirae]MCR1912308.1 prolipoprotein diacylglyceryl transferase [Enterococcus hirae]MDL4887572.1 prolipoprotein diacylglyceryl transferase [Enterococcus hirae]